MALHLRLILALFSSIGFLRGLGLTIRQAPSSLHLSRADERLHVWAHDLVTQLFAQEREISIVVIGANDGDPTSGHDPMIDALNRTNVRALMVEPNPPVFKTLKDNLDRLPTPSRLHPVNVAVCSNVSGQVPFYVVSPRFAEECPKAPHWAKYEVGSTSRERTLQWRAVKYFGCPFGKEKFETFLEEIQVPCLIPSDLMASSNVVPGEVDLFQVDAEGFDGGIVKSFMAEESFEPKLIIYEHKFLSYEERFGVIDLLHQRGYKVQPSGFNTFAWKDPTLAWPKMSDS